MSLQRDISHDSNQRLVGSLQRVIVDRREGDFWVGRTQYDSPEVDQEVFFPATMELTPGDFVTVRIAAADDYDLQGEVVTAEA